MRVTQAMILAAGLSTRLRPLTDELPKPLLPFWNKTILDFTLAFLKDGGIQSAAVNVHYGKQALLKALKLPQPIPLTPFIEEPAILETGGGIKNMASFVTEENFIVTNCDFISDIDLKEAVKFHLERKALATMVLLSGSDTQKYTQIGVDEQERIVTFPYGNNTGKPKASGMFSGIHIFNRAIFGEMPKEPIFAINRDVYPSLLAKGAPVFGFVTKGLWLDLGETKPYAEAQFALLKKHPTWVGAFLEPLVQTAKGVLIARNALVAPSARIKGPVLISERAEVGAGATLGPNVVLGPNVKVGEKSHLENCIVWPNVALLPETKLKDRICTPSGAVAF